MWINQEDQSQAFAVGYRAIMVHAVSRDPQAFDMPCIFVQLDSDFDEAPNDDDNEIEDGAAEDVSELRLAPADPDEVESIFQAMSDCAAMNPDSDVDDDEGEFFYNEDEVMAGVDPERREAMLDHFDSLLEPPPGDDLQEVLEPSSSFRLFPASLVPSSLTGLLTPLFPLVICAAHGG